MTPGSIDRSPTSVRDHLANERTFLAWVRTAVTFVGLGFAVGQLVVDQPVGHALGIAMMLVGGAMMLPALIDYRRTARAIEVGDYAPPTRTSTVLALAVIGGAAGLALLSLIQVL